MFQCFIPKNVCALICNSDKLEITSMQIEIDSVSDDAST